MTDNEGTIRDLVSCTYDEDDDVYVTAVVNHRVYGAFGQLLSETNPATGQPATVDCLFGYTGRPYDKLNKLQNNGYRWYEAGTGRWLSEDPLGFGGGDVNLSRYCGNSPTNYIDPSGLSGTGNLNDGSARGNAGGDLALERAYNSGGFAVSRSAGLPDWYIPEADAPTIGSKGPGYGDGSWQRLQGMTAEEVEAEAQKAAGEELTKGPHQNIPCDEPSTLVLAIQGIFGFIGVFASVEAGSSLGPMLDMGDEAGAENPAGFVDGSPNPEVPGTGTIDAGEGIPDVGGSTWGEPGTTIEPPPPVNGITEAPVAGGAGTTDPLETPLDGMERLPKKGIPGGNPFDPFGVLPFPWDL